MAGYVFVVPGDLTRVAADAVGFSTSRALEGRGMMVGAFRERVSGFEEQYRALQAEGRFRETGDTFWFPVEGSGKPAGVVVAVSTGWDRTVEEKKEIVTLNSMIKEMEDYEGIR